MTDTYPGSNLEIIEKAIYCNEHGDTESCENWLNHLRERLVASAAPAPTNVDDNLNATDGPLLELDVLLARFHEDVWDSASQSLCAYDEAGVEEAKAIQRHVRNMLASAAPAVVDVSDGPGCVMHQPTADEIEKLRDKARKVSRQGIEWMRIEERAEVIANLADLALAGIASAAPAFVPDVAAELRLNRHADDPIGEVVSLSDGTATVGLYGDDPKVCDLVYAGVSAAPAEVRTNDELMRVLTEYEGALQSEDEEEIAPAREALFDFLRPIRAALDAPAEGREVVDERAAWQTGEPPVKHGDADEFIVACRRAHNPSKIFVFSAHYANAYVDDNEDDEAKPRTGWFMRGMDMSGEYAYVYENICDNGDKIIAWQPLPKWGDEARAALATAPMKDDIAQAAFDRGLKAGNEQAVAQQKCILELQSKLDAASAPTMSEGSPILLAVLLNLVNADTLLAHSAGFTDRYDAQALLRKAFDDAREILGIDRANAEGEKS
jgi:hypothetical protein